MVLMCWRYGLYDAMIYVYNQGMNDYLTPLVEMFQVSNLLELHFHFYSSRNQGAHSRHVF